MATVLLTGASGLIGGYALQPLRAAGFHVHAVSRSPREKAAGTIWHQADLLDAADRERVFAEARPTHLLHLAWDTRPGEYLESGDNVAWATAGLDMLRLFRRHGGARAVLAGSGFEYGASDRPLGESSPLNPQTAYARCKAAFHELAAIYCRKNGVSMAWGRIFSAYGANERAGRLTPSIIGALGRGEPVTIRSGRLVRDYIYARDIAAACAALLGTAVEGPVNVSSGRGVRIEDYCRALAHRLGREDLLRFEDKAGDQPPYLVGDNRRLRDEAGFVPAYDLDRGFAEILADANAARRKGGTPDA